MTCLSEEMGVVGELPSGMSSGAAGFEFSDNESLTESLQKWGATPNRTKMISIVCGKTVEKMEKQLNLWIHDMMIH